MMEINWLFFVSVAQAIGFSQQANRAVIPASVRRLSVRSQKIWVRTYPARVDRLLARPQVAFLGALEAALSDTQDLAEELLYAEARLGEMLEKIPFKGEDLTSSGGRKVTLPIGVTHKDSHIAQELHRHENVITVSGGLFQGR